MATSEIGIERLIVECILGCLPQERVERRSIEVDVALTYRQAPVGDTIYNAVNYLDIAECVTATLINGSFHLLETAAQAIASALFTKFSSVDKLVVMVRKRGMVPGGECAYVRLTAERGDTA